MTTATKAALLTMMLCGAIAGTARAQAPPPQGALRAVSDDYIDARNGLSLAGAIAQALEREPMLRAARADVEVARGARAQAGLRPNPSVSVEWRDEPSGTDSQALVQLDWPLDLFRRSSRVAVGDREVETAERSVDEQRRLLVGDVRTRYGLAAAAVRDFTVADAVAASMRSALEQLRQQVAEGAASPLDRDRMEVELRRAEADRLRAAARADAAMFELRRAIGATPSTPLALRDTLDTLAPPPIAEPDGPANPAAGGLEVVQQRADIREAQARVALADSRIARARDEGRFDVSLFGAYTRMDQGFPQLGVNDSGNLERVRGVFHYLSIGAMISLPVLNRRQGDVAAAEAERTAAGARLEARRLAAQAELAAAEAREARARRALALAESGVRLARQNLDVTRQTYELGRATVSDVLVEQRRYLDAEQEYTETLREAYDASVEVMQARGEQ